jgi:hypothetical protein
LPHCIIGTGTLIADEAVAIYEAVKEQVEACRTELNGMEEAVKEQLSGKPKKKKKKKKLGKKGAAAAGGGGTTGLVGGVEVNLGDVASLYDLGSDDDDDDDSIGGFEM